MHYFPNLDSIPIAVIDHVKTSADMGSEVEFGYEASRSSALFRHHAAIREFLGVQSYYGTDTNEAAVRAAREAAEAMDQPVDIINATIDSLIQQQVELPPFSTLDAIAEQVHARTQTAPVPARTNWVSNASRAGFATACSPRYGPCRNCNPKKTIRYKERLDAPTLGHALIATTGVSQMCRMMTRIYLKIYLHRQMWQ